MSVMLLRCCFEVTVWLLKCLAVYIFHSHWKMGNSFGDSAPCDVNIMTVIEKQVL